MFCNQLRLLIVLNPPPVYNPRGPREDEVHIRSFWHRYRYHGRMVTRLGLEISRGCSWRGGRKRSGTTILRFFPTPTPVALPLVGMSLDPSQLDALWPGANRRSTPGASTKRSQGTEYAGQAQTFCKWNLGTRGETRMQSYWRGGGREVKAQAVSSTGAVPRWAQSLNRSQSRSRDSCQSHGSLQSHPCHFQKLGPTVQLKCGVHSANRWRIERGQE